ncbi:YceI family protein [Actinomycetes bacterium KLBMP 9797]
MTTPRHAARLDDGSLTGQWTLDPARSTVHLATRSMWGLAPVKGTFGELSGHGTLTPDGEATGTVTIKAASLDTKIKKRDEHLRSADFFDSANHPDIVFTAQRITRAGAGSVTVYGSLQVHGSAQPLSFTAAVSAAGDEVGFDAEVEIDRSDFGLTWNRLGMASMKNTITVHAIFTRHP